MKKLIGMVMALLLVFAVGAVWADEIQGKIKAVDTDERMFQLEDGTQISVAEGVPMETVKEGATVKVSYEERDGKKVATSIEAAE